MTVAGAATRVSALLAAAVLSCSTASCGSPARQTGPGASGPPVTATVPATPPPAGSTSVATTSASTSATTSATTSASTVPADEETSTTAGQTTPTSDTVPAPVLLRPGDSGPATASLQARLTDLGYWLGPVSGRFDDATEQAVYAVQKAAGLVPDGVVGPLTAGALADGTVPRPHSSEGRVVEVDLEHNLVMFVDGGKLLYTLNTSTGGEYVYTSDGITAVADTPRGRFSLFRQVDGMVVDSLGELWRPKYFYSGFALHGDAYVPPEPVSHGCVRVSNEAIDWIWSASLAPIGTAVWVY